MVDIQSSKDVIIIGAGGLARELVSWIGVSNQKDQFNLLGFLDDNEHALDSYALNLRIIGRVDFSQISGGESILFAIASSQVKKQLFAEAQKYKVGISAFQHDSTVIGPRCQIGEGLVMTLNSLISCDVKVGDLVFINSGSQIGHDVIIGDFVTIMANVDIGGGAVIGNEVFIGSGAVILPGVKICDGTRIGAGSVVLRSIKKPGTYFGNPAKRVF